MSKEAWLTKCTNGGIYEKIKWKWLLKLRVHW